MKRYRIVSFDFDSRAFSFDPVQESWSEDIKTQHLEGQRAVTAAIMYQYGEEELQKKVDNFVSLKGKPVSVSAFHNKFLEQIRSSYIAGSYYPALTGACALGERILNHLMILLRDYHRSSPEYKNVYRKNSFDYWPLAINTLESWGELLPEAAIKFRELNDKRNRAIHFNPDTDHNDKALALSAIHLIQEIVSVQFSAFGNQPWYLCISGEIYIKKEWEESPFVKNILIPNALLVGPNHTVECLIPNWVINEPAEYEQKEITDDEFHALRQDR